MANEEHVALLKQGIAIWNAWRKDFPDVKPDLRGKSLQNPDQPDFSGAHFQGADLRGCNLRYQNYIEANFTGADLSEAQLLDGNFTRATLRDTNFRMADLTLASFDEADLRGANLSGALLDETSFKKALLHQTVFASSIMRSQPDFTEASLGWTLFTNVHLGCVKGLETVHHVGPSSLDIETFYRSQGQMPEIFLRQAGFPDAFIELTRSFKHSAPYPTCMLSYAEADQSFSQQFSTDLLHRGVRCWLDAKKGDTLAPTWYLSDTLLLVLSEHSVKSDWVEHEMRRVEMKVQYEERPISLFLIVLDQSFMDAPAPWKRYARRDQQDIQDFTSWKDDVQYQRSLERLLAALSVNASDSSSLNEDRSQK